MKLLRNSYLTLNRTDFFILRRSTPCSEVYERPGHVTLLRVFKQVPRGARQPSTFDPSPET